MLIHLCRIGNFYFMDFRVRTQWNKIQHLRLDPVFQACQYRITHTVPAFITVQRCFHRFPSWRPDCPLIIDIEISTAHVKRYIIIAIACQAAEFCISVECIPACCIRYQSEKFFGSQIVDPRPWGLGIRNNVFSFCVVKISVFHIDPIKLFIFKKDDKST